MDVYIYTYKNVWNYEKTKNYFKYHLYENKKSLTQRLQKIL